MNDFTDEQLRLIASMMRQAVENGSFGSLHAGTAQQINTELTRRAEIAELDFDDCDSCKL